MGIRVFSESDRKRWDAFVLGADTSCCYHLIAWKDVIEKTFGHNTYYLFSSDEKGNINGILPLVEIRSWVFGKFIVSLPFFNYGGVCADNNEIRKELLREAVRIAENVGVDHLELRHTENIFDHLPVKTAKVSMILDLPEGAEDLWKSFTTKLRTKIRKPSKEGLFSRVGKFEELETFYTVFKTNMRDLGTPVYPKNLFANILRELPENTWICSVYTKDGNPAASGFLVGFKNRVEVPWGSSMREYNKHHINNLLYWAMLGFACEKGFSVFDFGRSTPGEGTYKFKEQWGAKPMQLYWHYWMRNGGPLPELNPRNPRYQLAIRAWKSLPIGLTNLIGPHIVKYLP